MTEKTSDRGHAVDRHVITPYAWYHRCYDAFRRAWFDPTYTNACTVSREDLRPQCLVFDRQLQKCTRRVSRKRRLCAMQCTPGKHRLYVALYQLPPKRCVIHIDA